MPLGPRWAAGTLAGFLTAAWLGAATISSGADWEKLSDTAGLVVERRPVAGSRSFELRVTARSRLSPASIFDTLWKQREYPEFMPHLKRLDLLSDTGDERVVYEQVAVPLARDRDYTVRIQKRVDAAAQRYEILFASANEMGPPPDNHHVRVQRIYGSWTVEPGADGKGSLLRYDLLTEPGGAIPAWVTNRAQREAVAALVTAVLKRALENEGPVIRRAPENEGPVIRRAPERDGQN
jgi:ribosome-associated toxin RatA of RatAB toxin-antitoxin module